MASIRDRFKINTEIQVSIWSCIVNKLELEILNLRQKESPLPSPLFIQLKMQHEKKLSHHKSKLLNLREEEEQLPFPAVFLESKRSSFPKDSSSSLALSTSCDEAIAYNYHQLLSSLGPSPLKLGALEKALTHATEKLSIFQKRSGLTTPISMVKPFSLEVRSDPTIKEKVEGRILTFTKSPGFDGKSSEIQKHLLTSLLNSMMETKTLVSLFGGKIPAMKTMCRFKNAMKIILLPLLILRLENEYEKKWQIGIKPTPKYIDMSLIMREKNNALIALKLLGDQLRKYKQDFPLAEGSFDIPSNESELNALLDNSYTELLGVESSHKDDKESPVEVISTDELLLQSLQRGLTRALAQQEIAHKKEARSKEMDLDDARMQILLSFTEFVNEKMSSLMEEREEELLETKAPSSSTSSSSSQSSAPPAPLKLPSVSMSGPHSFWDKDAFEDDQPQRQPDSESTTSHDLKLPLDTAPPRPTPLPTTSKPSDYHALSPDDFVKSEGVTISPR